MFKDLSKDIDSKKSWQQFSIKISFVIISFIICLFIGLLYSQQNVIEAGLISRSRSHFKNITLARLWNSNHGGVYVEKLPDVKVNPLVKNSETQTVDGRTFILKNPATMTREISELTKKGDDFQFKITSLKLINPNNKADKFEEKALKEFESGLKEIFLREKRGNKTFFRYMGPLYVKNSCLKCHEYQGYKKGDIRGGISLSFNIDVVETLLLRDRAILFSIFILTSTLLLVLVYYLIFNLNKQLSKAQEKINKLAITDELTGLYNRRYFRKVFKDELKIAKRYRHSYGCLMMDVDHFKKVNDTYGHYAGDIILRKLGKLLKANSRESDIVARYGGEEFINLLPETDIVGASIVAEKLRAEIEAASIKVGEIEIKITVSIGISCFDATKKDDPSTDQLISAADNALYKAKENGRNRIEKDC